MINLLALEKYLKKVLGPDQPQKEDIMPDGLQVRGRNNVKAIGFAVSASLKLFELAEKCNIDCLIVHHGLPLPYRYIDDISYARIKYLMTTGMSLFGYHYLLDSHPVIGNNAVILKKMGLKSIRTYLPNDWGLVGQYPKRVDIDRFLGNCDKVFNSEQIRYLYGPSKIKKVLSISGGYAPSLQAMQDLIDNKIDLFIGGESREHLREYFREANIHFIGAGHYNTEVFGVRALLTKVQNNFGDKVKCIFLDLPNKI